MEVDHAQASERHRGNDVRVLPLGYTPLGRVVPGVKRDRQESTTLALFDGDGPHIVLRLSADDAPHGLVKNFGTTTVVKS